MKAVTLSVPILWCGLLAAASPNRNEPLGKDAIAVSKGIQWLVSVQGKDGGWGQDGGETTFVRQGERLEHTGNDVANTAVSLLALHHTGTTPEKGAHAAAFRRGLDFILKQVEESPDEGLVITKATGTQIQRKLGPFIDTFLTSMLLGELDGNLKDRALQARVRSSLTKCVRKIEANQMKDGSWNISGGWAPILGTSMASRSLSVAAAKGVKVDEMKMAKVNEYTKDSIVFSGAGRGVGAGVGGGAYGAVAGLAAETVSPAPLYQAAQQLEELSRTEKDRRDNKKEIQAIAGRLSDSAFVRGYGSMGGEEFFSYLNISDSLRRTGGPEWDKWNAKIKTTLVDIQNENGTWAGHHCITGRVAVTSAALLTLVSEHQPLLAKK